LPKITPSLMKWAVCSFLLDQFLAAVAANFAPRVRKRTSKDPSACGGLGVGEVAAPR
jgi:hypothetical protein